MSYTLDKPYTDIQRADFIVEHNHRNGRKIIETETALYALEPNEMMQDGEIIINPDWEEQEKERLKNLKIEEINSKISELEQMSVSELLYCNEQNVKVYQEVIQGLIDTKNSL